MNARGTPALDVGLLLAQAVVVAGIALVAVLLGSVLVSMAGELWRSVPP